MRNTARTVPLAFFGYSKEKSQWLPAKGAKTTSQSNHQKSLPELSAQLLH